MHYCGKLIIAPTSNPIEEVIDRILAPFQIDSQRSDIELSSRPFYDYWTLRGRPGFPSTEVRRLDRVTADEECYRLIVADSTNEEAAFMIERYFWNGVTHVQSTWNGYLLAGLRLAPRFVEQPKDDWLVVTIDYHS